MWLLKLSFIFSYFHLFVFFIFVPFFYIYSICLYTHMHMSILIHYVCVYIYIYMCVCVCVYIYICMLQLQLPRWLSGKESACQCRRHRFDPWVRKSLWSRKWQLTPVFLPGKFRGGGDWWATVHGVAKCWTWLSEEHSAVPATCIYFFILKALKYIWHIINCM